MNVVIPTAVAVTAPAETTIAVPARTIDGRALLAALAESVAPARQEVPRLLPLPPTLVRTFDLAPSPAGATAASAVRADLFGIAAPPPGQVENINDAFFAHDYRAGYDAGIRTVGAHESRAIVPLPATQPERRVPPTDGSRLAPADRPLAGDEFLPDARTLPAPLRAAPPSAETAPMPLLIGLLGTGALLALRPCGAASARRAVVRAWCRVARAVLQRAGHTHQPFLPPAFGQ